ncbi:uncharacterized protein EI90DRAFT_693671 [Cantharellus anzutake]|uniref:uncharacterized protein n=1 Tax=Cantharellus anzutake TaxID=1750568 RepID=UPI001906DF35|nr:uncharacterized protein EI90DRAFT_693671 [Cantharellus anzutake]KAF8332727.1 hypothetical protein EI90DRAFT_693671 [Cantharellus anzutake]
MANTTGPIQVGGLRTRHANITYSDQRRKAFRDYQRKLEQLQEVLEKCATNVRKITVAVILADGIGKLQRQLHSASDVMRRTICPLWGEATPSEAKDGQDLSDSLPEKFKTLAQLLEKFDSGLKILPGFNQVQYHIVEEVHRSLLDFKQDLLYWNINLLQFSGNFYRNASRHHISTIADHMSNHLGDITKALEEFLGHGLYTIRYYERRPTFENLSTVATLFAGVSASTIQLSYDGNKKRLFEAVQFLWIFSLCLSIASAISSQVSYRWSSAVYIKSDLTPPWLVSAWIVTAPFTFLVISVGSFAIGIALFTFLKFGDAEYIRVCVTAALVIWTIGSLLVYMWFFIDLRVIKPKKKKWVGTDDIEKIPKTPVTNQSLPSLPPGQPIKREPVLNPDTDAPQNPRLVVRKTLEASQWTDIIPLLWELDITPSEYRRATSNFRRLVMRVVESNRTPDLVYNYAQIRQNSKQERISRTKGVATLLESQADEWTGMHLSAVHDIKFSADGDYLATCSQDQKVMVWAMRPEVKTHFSFRCDPNTQPHRLSWHPKHLLLAVMPVRSADLVICDLSGAGKPTVSSCPAKQGPVKAVTWMPNKESLVYTEGHHVRCFNRDGEEWNIDLTYSLDEVAVTPDGTKLVVVGTVDSVEVDGKQLKPSKFPPERRIILIEIDGRAKIFETPTLNQVRGLDVSFSGALLLVTYEGKAFPQLFRIHSTWLVLLQTYCPPNEEVEYSGCSQLGIRGWASGVDGLRIDECAVMCADKKGFIFICDRGSSDLVHTLRVPLGRASHLTGFAWNHEHPTIAASSANGTIWFYNPYGSGIRD